MKKITTALRSYAFFILVGGLIGFFKAGSLASLIMSSLFAFLLTTSSVIIHRRFKIGFYSALSSTIFLCLFFAYRLILVQKMMPSGLMLFLSLAMLNFLYFSVKKNKLLKTA
ncbi:MAG: TMEM14 family protein [Parachlamydiaceae bacterium]